MAKNKRIYYANHQVGIKGIDPSDGSADATFTEIHGVQSASQTINFQLEQVFELGQLALYENIEQIPNVEVSVNKVLDGYPLIYCLATLYADDPTLVGRSNEKCIFGMSIFSDTANSCEGAPGSVVQCSGAFVNSVTYNFPVDGNCTEEVSFVANNRVWRNALDHGDDLNPSLPNPMFSGAFSGNDDEPIGVGGVNRRRHVLFDYDAGEGLDINGMVADSNATILPPEVFGISDSGTNEKDANDEYGAHVQSISVSASFNRDQLNELGRFGPYHRNVNFPLEVTCEIQTISTSGDYISGVEEGIYSTGTDQCNQSGNLKNRTIRVAVCEGTRLYLGTKNKLSNVSYSGGDSGGGNVTTTYSFSNFNDLTVMHSGDPNSNFTWSGRDTYLRDV